MTASVQLLLLFYFLSNTGCAYRLNVPRVLLPYHPTTHVKFELAVSDPDGGCFTWRSTRPDIVTVKVVEPKQSSGCSARATIIATSKHAEEQTSVVFAEDRGAGLTLSCGVTVDVISRIAISTTTKVLFLDASPAKISVQAFNAEGDMFSTLGDISFDWHLDALSAGDRPLRIVPFSQSKYEAPDGVRKLEENKKRGYVVLVEGVSSGAAVLNAKLNEPHFKHVESQKIELIVVANLLLVPSQDLYIPLGAVVQYQAEIVKQSTTQPITLPSKQYHLTMKNTEVCLLDVESSRITAKQFGATEISLIDENVKTMNILKPPSAHIYVVEPLGLYFVISGGSWYLQNNEEYTLSVLVTDSDDNIMFIPKNANFETILPEKYFKVLWKSNNNTHFHVKAIKSGVAKITSRFHSILNDHGTERIIPVMVRGEEIVTISDAIEVYPSVIFPYIDSTTIHSWQLQAKGGTGSFIWSSTDPNISAVDSNGLVSSGKPGMCDIIATDIHNSAHRGKTVIKVVNANIVGFGKSRLEVQIEHEVVLYLTLHADLEGETVAVTDCHHVEFAINISDANIVRRVDDKNLDKAHPENGCKSLKFKGLKSGDALITASFGNSSASTYLSVYPPLKIESPAEVLILLGSRFTPLTSGGPRPWLLDSSRFFSRTEYSNASNLITHEFDGKHTITCKESKGDLVVKLLIGNEPTVSNPIPETSVAQIRICCGIPNHFNLFISRPPSIEKSCPKNSRVIRKDQSSDLSLVAFGYCESGPSMHLKRQFNSINSLEVHWRVNDSSLLKVEESKQKLSTEVYGVSMKPEHKAGMVEITAQANSCIINKKIFEFGQMFTTNVDILLVDLAHAYPSSVLMLSDKRLKKTIEVKGGSGDFAVISHDPSVLQVTMKRNTAEVRPLNVGKSVIDFSDLCIGTKFSAKVSVTDVEQISVEAPEFISVVDEEIISLKVQDNEGLDFLNDDLSIVNTQMNSSSSAATVTKIDGLNFILRGNSIGVVTLVATVLTTSGRTLHSQPHMVQVFAPLHFSPDVLSLVPHSLFQLEVLGGPQPLPKIMYEIEKTSIAEISTEGMILTKEIGTTVITGSISIGHNSSIRNSVLLEVVSLKGIHIRASTTRLQVGEKAWARIEGIDNHQTPFAFAGAIQPMKIAWSVTTPDVLEMIPAFHKIMMDSTSNQFQIEFKALRAGETTLRAVVKSYDESSKNSEISREYRISITAVDPFEFLSAAHQPRAVIMSSNSQLILRTNRKENRIKYAVPANMKKYLQIVGEKNDVLSAKTHGSAALAIMEVNDPFNETTFVPISIMPIHSLHLETVLPSVSGDSFPFLPLGCSIRVFLSFRDHIGRIFDVSSSSLNYRPHRYDLTDIKTGNDNRTFDIRLKKEGETILKIWDQSNLDLNVYLRLSVGELVLPSVKSVVESSIVCFTSPLINARWTEIGGKHHFNFLNSSNGVAVAEEVGNTMISSSDVDDQTTFKQITVVAASSLRFATVPSFISDIIGRQFLVYLSIENGDNTSTTATYGCSSSQLETLDTISVPFDCIINFDNDVNVLAASLMTSRSIFSPSTGQYACLIEEQNFDRSSTLMENRQISLLITAVWRRNGKVKKTSVKLPFYPRFNVVQKEIRFNNVDSMENMLVIHTPSSLNQKIFLETCPGDVLYISDERMLTSSIIQYQIKLNVKSAVLWREMLDKCNLTIKNAFTGQVETVPVTIVLHGDTYKVVMQTSGNLLGSITETIQSSAMIIFTAVAVLLLALAHYRGYSLRALIFGSVANSDFEIDNEGHFGKSRAKLALRPVAPVSSSTPITRKSLDLRNVSMFSSDVSPLSSLDRSASNKSDQMLWSVPDRFSTSADFRRRRQF